MAEGRVSTPKHPFLLSQPRNVQINAEHHVHFLVLASLPANSVLPGLVPPSRARLRGAPRALGPAGACAGPVGRHRWGRGCWQGHPRRRFKHAGLIRELVHGCGRWTSQQEAATGRGCRCRKQLARKPGLLGGVVVHDAAQTPRERPLRPCPLPVQAALALPNAFS